MFLVNRRHDVRSWCGIIMGISERGCSTIGHLEVIIIVKGSFPSLELHCIQNGEQRHISCTTHYDRSFLRGTLRLSLLRLDYRLASDLRPQSRYRNQLTCSSSPINCSSVTRPRSCPDCAILKRIASICRDRSGLTSAMRDTAAPEYKDRERCPNDAYP